MDILVIAVLLGAAANEDESAQLLPNLRGWDNKDNKGENKNKTKFTSLNGQHRRRRRRRRRS